MFSVQSTAPHAYSTEDEQVLQAIASQTAIAVRDAFLYQETQFRLRALELLQEFSLRLAGPPSLYDIASTICHTATVLLHPKQSRVYLKSGNGGTPLVAAGCRDEQVLNEESLLPPPQEALDALASKAQDSPRLHAINGGMRLVYTIRAGAQTPGVIVLDYEQARRLRPDEDRFLSLLAQQAVVAIERAYYISDLQERFEQVSALHRLAEQVTGNVDSQAIMQQVVDTLRAIFRCRACVLFRYDREAEHITIEAASGIKPRWQAAARLKPGEGLAGYVLQTGKPLNIPDLREAANAPIFDPEVRSVIGVPVIYKGDVIGVLNLDSDQPHAFSVEHERVLVIAASQVAAALEIARLYQQETLRAQKLEEANLALERQERLRQELVQNLAHELRTPLTYIKGYTSLLKDGELGPITEEQDSALGIVMDKTEVLQQLIQDVVTLEQISEKSLDFEVVDFGELIAQVFDAARTIHSSESLRFKLERAHETTPVLVCIDRTRINQALDNLISNAVKFSPGGGTITIGMRVDREAGRVACSVSDTGIGIAPDHLQRIFERFYQVRDPDRQGIGGSGIGLALVQRIVRAHGGEVQVASKKGEGSTFTIVLPLCEAPQE
ncbi:MAG: hypothetical protein Kow0077_02840 [Anaerolineae bacterium]